MITANEVKNRMNNATAPFIFGVDYEMERGFFVENPLSQHEILWRAGSATNHAQRTTQRGKLLSKPMSYEQYEPKFDAVHRELMYGNSFLANLTIKTPVETELTFEEIFEMSNSQYAVVVPERFVCFSPETFVQIEGGRISSNPMKGTISGLTPNAEAVILNDYKESAEHYTIVDFIRSDLSRVATNITVDRFRYIDRLHTSGGEILQVSSMISGDLTTSRLGDTIWELLPAGSISGAPKRKTVEILRHAESESRGYYTGIFGYFDGNRLNSAVMIRYIEQQNGKLYFRSGGGITINSECRPEYEEALAKIYLPFQ